MTPNGGEVNFKDDVVDYTLRDTLTCRYTLCAASLRPTYSATRFCSQECATAHEKARSRRRCEAIRKGKGGKKSIPTAESKERWAKAKAKDAELADMPSEEPVSCDAARVFPALRLIEEWARM